ncbi:MAG: hypothetical protein HZA24_10730 [Nitrospirae bacterium]|nr:hypothetical protein [Nitrospirota bacterium]
MNDPRQQATPAERQGGDVDHDLIAVAEGDRFTDADLYGQIDKSQRRTPWWLWVMVGVVLLLAVVLNAPFLTGHGGDVVGALSRGGDGPFLDGGMVAGLLYVGGGFAFLFWFTWMRKGSS